MSSDGAAQCFMCQQAGPQGCLECRTHRLIADIKHALYERLGAEQNQSEWEERALDAETELTRLREREKGLVEALKRNDKALCEVREHLIQGREESALERLARGIFDNYAALSTEPEGEKCCPLRIIGNERHSSTCPRKTAAQKEKKA